MRLTFYLQAVLEVERILTCLRKVVAQLSGESVRTDHLAELLTGAGYSSGHVAPRLASKLCINFLQVPWVDILLNAVGEIRLFFMKDKEFVPFFG